MTEAGRKKREVERKKAGKKKRKKEDTSEDDDEGDDSGSGSDSGSASASDVEEGTPRTVDAMTFDPSIKGSVDKKRLNLGKSHVTHMRMHKHSHTHVHPQLSETPLAGSSSSRVASPLGSNGMPWRPRGWGSGRVIWVP